jgi:hypothetical protein
VLRAEGVEPSRRALPVPLPGIGGRVGLLGRFGIGAPGSAEVTSGLIELCQAAMAALMDRG